MFSKLLTYWTLGSSNLLVHASTLTSKINTLLGDGDGVYGQIKDIALKVGIVVGAVGGLAWAFSPSGKGAEKGKTIVFAAIGSVVLIYLMPTIMDTVKAVIG